MSSSSAAFLRRCAAAVFRMRSPKPTLSSALMFGNRL